MIFYIYDLETMPNCFVFNGKFKGDSRVQTFELSERKNQRSELLSWLSYLQNQGAHMVGFNSLAFDYPIIHSLLLNPYTFDHHQAASLCQQIIGAGDYGFERIRMNDRIIPQIDLVKINHFDNNSRRTSLKALQFAMRSESVEDLPYDPLLGLTSEQMDLLISYGIHDVTETEKFLGKCEHLIAIRQEMLEHGVLTGDVLNYSDVKLGTEYLVNKIGRTKCFVGSKPKQTIRTEVDFKDVILPKVHFRTEPFNAVLDWFKAQKIYVTSSDRPRLEATLGGVQFHFGVGGVHASVESKKFESTSTHVIRDVDVSGMYPAVCNVNGFAPEHLGKDFTRAYAQLGVDRKQYPKGTAMNLVLKLAGNGASGNFENPYSCLYDVKCAYSMRINGQLQLLQLAEFLSLLPGLQLIQANTDGVTALVPRELSHWFDFWCSEWECQTGLKLEHKPYAKMFIRDVNNYLAIGEDGSIKRKGAYWYPITPEDYHGSSGTNWNKDFSNLASIKAAEYCMVHEMKPEQVIRLITDPFDFMLRYKTPGGAKLYIGGQEQTKTVRYYVSKAGQSMSKKSLPKGKVGDWKKRNGLKDDEFKKILATIPEGAWDDRIHTKNKSKYQEVITSIESGRLVKNCNRASDFNWSDLDYDYYVEETKKLLIGV